MKKATAVLLSAAMLVSCAAGCGKRETADANAAKNSKYLVSEKPIELSIFSYATAVPFEAENSVFKEAAKLTNVSLKCTVSKNVSDAAQAFQLMIASGNIPDIVHHSKREDFLKYGTSGAFEPLNSLIEQYAPNISEAMDSPLAKSITSDASGNIYFVPFFPGGVAQQGWFIREDWLDKLGLKKPTNVSEMYNVLKAFKEQDPNGNGKQDEVPLFMTGGAGSIISILGSFGGYHGIIYDENGKVEYGPMKPEFKEAYKTMAQWYKEGLIDKEIYTRGNNANTVLLSNDQGGCTYNWFGSTAALNDAYKESIPGFKFTVIAPPAGKASRRPSVKGVGWAISATNKHKVETMKYFDFWFTDKGELLQNYGIEGVHYDMVNGKPTFKDTVLNNKEKSVNAQLGEVGAQISIGCRQDFEYEKQWLNKYAIEGMEMYEKNGYCGDEFVYPEFTPDEEKRYNELNGIIASYVDETAQQWVLGVKSVDGTYDEYLSYMKKLGVDELVEIYQRAQDRANSKLSK